MEGRISAVQQILLFLLVASLALAVVARPHPENRSFTGALDELTQFRAGFRRTDLESTLKKHAEAQGMVPLSAVRSEGSGVGVPTVSVPKEAPPIRPLTQVSLATLADVHAHAGPESTLAIGVPEVPALSAALSWRLLHAQNPAPVTVTGVTLSKAAVSLADVKLEYEVAQLRVALGEAQQEVDAKGKKLKLEQDVLVARRKRGLPWKTILKSMEAVKVAEEALAEASKAYAELDARYQNEAKRALSPRAENNAPGVPGTAVANVTIKQDNVASVLAIPVVLKVRDVSVPALPGGSFPAVHGAGLWSDVKDLDVDAAIAHVQDRFNWHNRSLDVFGIKLSGALLLHALPCLLPLLLGVLLLRMRAVGANYSPFRTKVRGRLPRVGFRSRFFDWVVLIVLPVLVVLSAAASLLLIGQLPLLPALTAVLSLVLGVLAASRLRELQELIDSVVQSHSYPPPE